MRIKSRVFLVGILATVLTVLVACGTQQPEVASRVSSPEAMATTPPASTATPTVVPTEPPEEWDYVVIGDYGTGGWEDDYAAQIEADLDVKLTIRDWLMPGLGSASLAKRLANNDNLRDQISDAEVVTIVIPVPFMQTAEGYGELYTSYLEGTCGGPDNQDCLREALRLYQGDVEDIVAELLALRSTSDTIIRVGDCWLSTNHTEAWRAQGVDEVLKSYWEAANEQAAQVAADSGIPVARLFLAMNGPDGEDVPDAYVHSGESGRFANDTGKAVIAGAFRELGYEPFAP